MLAPFMPYVTEEVWSWRFAADVGRDRSVHTTAWPVADEVAAVPAPAHRDTFDLAVEVVSAVRGFKTTAQKSLKWPIAKLEIVGPAAAREALEPVLEDILRTGNVVEGGADVRDGEPLEGQRFKISVELAESMDP
jgi:valyl-tRNA synthetase